MRSALLVSVAATVLSACAATPSREAALRDAAAIRPEPSESRGTGSLRAVRLRSRLPETWEASVGSSTPCTLPCALELPPDPDSVIVARPRGGSDADEILIRRAEIDEHPSARAPATEVTLRRGKAPVGAVAALGVPGVLLSVFGSLALAAGLSASRPCGASWGDVACATGGISLTVGTALVTTSIVMATERPREIHLGAAQP
jgi:hypothetical protein